MLQLLSGNVGNFNPHLVCTGLVDVYTRTQTYIPLFHRSKGFVAPLGVVRNLTSQVVSLQSVDVDVIESFVDLTLQVRNVILLNRPGSDGERYGHPLCRVLTVGRYVDDTGSTLRVGGVVSSVEDVAIVVDEFELEYNTGGRLVRNFAEEVAKQMNV